mmetsp:Transcript_66845/g.105745  ORF Transcript_66845/g.105745 Transcript_66845/m.105745 type:complete len:230 (-) Transcript_66845:105-794(-)
MQVDPSTQWDWHEAHRDCLRNQYRTTYTDMVHFKEVSVKSNYPSGYGGHVPLLRHDILFRNTAFDRQQVLKRNDPSRDAHPSFEDQIAGIPTWCAKPRGAKKNPTFKVVPHDGTTSYVRPPWAVLRPVKDVPGHRNVPATIVRARSMPTVGLGSRVNQAAVGVGANVAMAPTGAMLQSTLAAPQSANVQDRIQRTVSAANEEAKMQRMPTEQEMLMGEMFGDQDVGYKD